MRLQRKLFETLVIDEDSHTDKESCWIKKCVGVVYATIKLSHVPAVCAFSIWEYLRSEEVKNIHHFLLHSTAELHVLLLYLSGISDMHFCSVLPSLKLNKWHIILNRQLLLAVCEGQINFLLGKYKVLY